MSNNTKSNIDEVVVADEKNSEFLDKTSTDTVDESISGDQPEITVDETDAPPVVDKEEPEVMSAEEKAPLSEPEVVLADMPVDQQVAELTTVVKMMVANLGVDAERNMKELFPILR